MKNITLAIDDEVLDRARLVAAQRRTTVNAMVREFLAEVGMREDKVAEARRQLLHLMDTSEGRVAPDWRFDRKMRFSFSGATNLGIGIVRSSRQPKGLERICS
jgi:hypothetical protein